MPRSTFLAPGTIKQLGRRGDVHGLVAALGWDDVKQSHDLRFQIAYELGETGSPDAVGPLLDLLEDEGEHEVVRSRAAISLGKLGDPRAVPALIAVLRGPSKKLQMWAAESLGEIGDERAVGPLASVLQSKDWGVRSYATRALGGIDHPDVVAPLIASLTDSKRRVRVRAAQALAGVGDQAALESLRNAEKREWFPPAKAIIRKAAQTLELRLSERPTSD